MDGSAIYYPMACIWLAYMNGIEPDAASYVLLVILGTLGSIGAAPVPYSSLVLIVSCSVDLNIAYHIVIFLPQCEANMFLFSCFAT
jgi:Na+/H+-dicarboxylate symporter